MEYWSISPGKEISLFEKFVVKALAPMQPGLTRLPQSSHHSPHLPYDNHEQIVVATKIKASCFQQNSAPPAGRSGSNRTGQKEHKKRVQSAVRETSKTGREKVQPYLVCGLGFSLTQAITMS
ncbi:unnamed protein product, partial [Ectocarpus sp. 8 AP-2014]